MGLTRLCLLELLFVWRCTGFSYPEFSAITSSKLFLEIRNVAKSDVVETEAVVSEAVAEVSRKAKWARTRVFNSQNIFSNQPGLPNGVTVSSAAQQRSDNIWAIIQNILINTLVIIPCVAVGGPLFWIWYHLEPVGKGDVVYTAMDADLRDVEISRVGASGVALLRRQCDRHTGIMFAFTGIMLQTIFIYFIAVSCVLRIQAQAAYEGPSVPTPIILLFCSLFCNTMVCCSSVILGMKCLATNAPEGYQELHEMLVLLDSFVIPGMCTIVGALYLCTSNGISSLVFDATAMGFIISINMQIAGLMSWSLSGHGGRAFQPANVSIKDSENSTQHAYYSFYAGAVVATVMIPLGLLAGVVVIVLVVIATVLLPFGLRGYHQGHYRSLEEFRDVMYEAFLRIFVRCECVKKSTPKIVHSHNDVLGP